MALGLFTLNVNEGNSFNRKRGENCSNEDFYQWLVLFTGNWEKLRPLGDISISTRKYGRPNNKNRVQLKWIQHWSITKTGPSSLRHHTSYFCQWLQPRPLVNHNGAQYNTFKSHCYCNNNNKKNFHSFIGQFVLVQCITAAKQQHKNQENVSELEDVNRFNVVSQDLFTPIYLLNASNFLELWA